MDLGDQSGGLKFASGDDSGIIFGTKMLLPQKNPSPTEVSCKTSVADVDDGKSQR